MGSCISKASKVQECDQAPIPKRLVFIAIGPVPEQYLTNIRSIASAAMANGLVVEIIVRKKQEFYNSVLKKDVDFFSGALSQVRLLNIEEIFEEARRDPEFLRKSVAPSYFPGKKMPSKKVLDILENFTKKNMVGLKNLATVSDILRSVYLAHRGGYYLDWDLPLLEDSKTFKWVFVGEKLRSKKFYETYEIKKGSKQIQHAYDHGFKICPTTSSREDAGDFFTVNCHMLGCAPYHPIINIVFHLLTDIIKKRSPEDENLARGYGADKIIKSKRFTLTIETGPECYVKALSLYASKFNPNPKNNYSLFTFKKGNHSFYNYLTVFGIKVIDQSASLWARKPKDLPKYFDDSALIAARNLGFKSEQRTSDDLMFWRKVASKFDVDKFDGVTADHDKTAKSLYLSIDNLSIDNELYGKVFRVDLNNGYISSIIRNELSFEDSRSEKEIELKDEGSKDHYEIVSPILAKSLYSRIRTILKVADIADLAEDVFVERRQYEPSDGSRTPSIIDSDHSDGETAPLSRPSLFSLNPLSPNDFEGSLLHKVVAGQIPLSTIAQKFEKAKSEVEVEDYTKSKFY